MGKSLVCMLVCVGCLFAVFFGKKIGIDTSSIFFNIALGITLFLTVVWFCWERPKKTFTQTCQEVLINIILGAGAHYFELGLSDKEILQTVLLLSILSIIELITPHIKKWIIGNRSPFKSSKD